MSILCHVQLLGMMMQRAKLQCNRLNGLQKGAAGDAA